ncbi:DUF5919 domain-containing protein [Streptomyces sp. NPDC007172]|uniref:DUF5919 domain-containing protein n=1 Tax=Streptomyces sp. NPDC007172 TaxID=3364776 RepID=UPI0036A28151
MNIALRSAMADADTTPRQLATRLKISTKQVERWISDPALIPHPRNRADVASTLGVDESMLWPSVVRQTLKTGPDREIVTAYPFRSAAPSALWGQLIADAKDDLLFAGFTNYFFWTMIPQFDDLLRRKADAGCRVRFLIGDPAGETTRQREAVEDTALSVSTRIRITTEHLDRLGPLDGLEARYSAPEDGQTHVSLSVFRFDHAAMVTPHLARVVGHDSPAMHLRRHQDGGLFDRFAEHAEELWGRGRPVGS